MNVVEEVKRLGLPRGEYVVIGSGIMAALRIREAQDVDVLVNKRLYEKFKADGWEEKDTIENRKKLSRGDIELYTDFSCGGYKPKTEELIQKAVIIQDIAFIPLDELTAFKKELGREKDIKDIKLIEEYLKSDTIKV